MEPYFYTDRHNKPQGPVDIHELTKHGVNPSTLVWRQGMPDWQCAGQLTELAGLFPPPLPINTPPPIPPNLPKQFQQPPMPAVEIGTATVPAEIITPPAYIAPSVNTIQVPYNDAVIHSGKANHFLHGESVGGTLYLYQQKLQFKSHSLNIQNHDSDFELKQIEEVFFYNTLGLVPNGLAIRLLNGNVEKFVVYKRKEWKKEIDNLLSGDKK
jgi:GYF domain 2